MSTKTKNRNLLLVSYFSNTFGFSLFVPLYAAFIVQLDQSPERASFLWALYTFLFAVSVMVIGRVQDKRSQKTYTRLLVAGYVLRLLATILFINSLSNFSVFAVGLLIYGLGSAFLTPSWFGLFVKQTNNHTSLNFSLSEGGGALFSALGAGVGGLLFAIGGYEYIFYFMALMHLTGLISAKLVRS